MPKILVLFLLATAATLAQSPFGFGLKAGVPLNDALSTTPGGAINYFQSTHRYTIGPYAEFRRPELAGYSLWNRERWSADTFSADRSDTSVF